MLETADVEVNDMSVLVSDWWRFNKAVTMFIFDTSLFTLHLPDTTVRSNFLLSRRPDWGGLILEMMKKNEKVCLFWGSEWCRVLYRENLDDFSSFIGPILLW